MNLKGKTDKKLIADFKKHHSAVYLADCYGVGDLIMLDEIKAEMDKRGIEVETDIQFTFTKNGEEIEA